MNDVVINQPLELRCANNPYLPEINGLRAFQQKQLSAFQERGLPTRKEELWKYTDVSRLAKQEFCWAKKTSAVLEKKFGISIVFVNGHFDPLLSDLSLLPENVLLCPLSEAFEQCAEEVKPYITQAFDLHRHPFVVLNNALMTDGVFISVPKNTIVSTPIHCLYLNTQQQDFMIHPRNIIIADANSQVTVIEEYLADRAENYFTNAVTILEARENAHVHYHKIQAEHTTASHIASLLVNQQQNSTVSCFNLAVGARLAREDVLVGLQARGASCHLNGFYYLSQNLQHIDNHLHVDHIAPHGTSSMNYKGILDKKSRAVFNGKVYVHKDAQQINAQQANHNLLLSADAEIDTKPELEIYADDVKCTHGATVGQLDAESLFYLRARGIEHSEAVNILTHAFADDVFSKIENPAIKDYIELRAGRHDQ